MKTSGIRQDVLGQPVTIGGFVWDYAFVWEMLRASGLSRREQPFFLVPALQRGADPHCPDTRGLPQRDLARLWNAVRSGSTPVVEELLDKHWVRRADCAAQPCSMLNAVQCGAAR